jgi:Flp pilus assembly pilin Flp
MSYFADRVRAFVTEEEGQDGVEYLLVIGGVSVGIVLAMLAVPGFIPAVISGVCDAVATIPGMTAVSC